MAKIDGSAHSSHPSRDSEVLILHRTDRLLAFYYHNSRDERIWHFAFSCHIIFELSKSTTVLFSHETNSFSCLRGQLVNKPPLFVETPPSLNG